MTDPADEASLAAAIAEARSPLRVVGGGTRLGIGRAIEGRPLSTRRLTGTILYDPAALTLVVRAGTPLDEVTRLLAASNQRLAFEPPDWRGLLDSTGTATIGGIVACNLSGPRRVQAGAARDFLLGLRFADGMGNVIKSGGRVMKNVTGLDLTRLLAGSYGTLGIITEVALKVLPIPETTTTLILRGLSPEAAVAAMSSALGSPFEVSGAAHDLQSGETLLRLEGFAATLPDRAERLRQMLTTFGLAELLTDQSETTSRWSAFAGVSAFADQPGAVWKLSVKPGDAPAILSRLRAAIPALQALFDWGGGLIWALVPEDSASLVRPALAPSPGHATLIRACVATRSVMPVFHPQAPGVEALCEALRLKFDPRGILNPGLTKSLQSRS